MFVIKMASAFYDNPSKFDGLASGNGIVLVFSAETGYPVAVLQGYILIFSNDENIEKCKILNCKAPSAEKDAGKKAQHQGMTALRDNGDNHDAGDGPGHRAMMAQAGQRRLGWVR